MELAQATLLITPARQRGAVGGTATPGIASLMSGPAGSDALRMSRWVRAVLCLALATGGVLMPSPPAASARCAAGRAQVVVERTVRGNTDLWGLTADATPIRLTTAPAPDRDPSWSPDATALVFVRGTGRERELWILDVETCEQRRLTNDHVAQSDPDWGEGGLIAFTRRVAGDADVAVMSLHDGKAYPWAWGPGIQRRPSWSPFDDQIAYESNEDGDWDVYRADESFHTAVTDDPGDELHPAWSPDGDVIAFTTRRDGNVEVYSVRPDGSAMTRLTETAFDEAEPAWGRYGLEILVSRRSQTEPVVVSFDRAGGPWDPVGIRGVSVDVRGPSEFQRWRDSLAERSVRRTVAIARRWFVDNGTYDGLTVVTLATLEPELTFVNDTTASGGPYEVSVSAQGSVFTAVACSATGACFAMQDTDNAVSTFWASYLSGDRSAADAVADGVTWPAWPYA